MNATTRRFAKKFTALAALPIAAALTLSACGEEETETSFTNSQNGIEITMTYTAVGDEVTKQTTTNEIDYEAAGLGGKEEAQQMFDPVVEQAADVEGYEQSIEYGDTSATEEVSIDYEVADLEELANVPGYEGSANMAEGDYISLDESRTMLEEAGFTEVE
ncbi:MAG: DUF1307 domain-containing protein [Micrococcaceae bacterium]|nr:DUF1307 domain-containing protein [Micrococcaceae bacterium]